MAKQIEGFKKAVGGIADVLLSCEDDQERLSLLTGAYLVVAEEFMEDNHRSKAALFLRMNYKEITEGLNQRWGDLYKGQELIK